MDSQIARTAARCIDAGVSLFKQRSHSFTRRTERTLSARGSPNYRATADRHGRSDEHPCPDGNAGANRYADPADRIRRRMSRRRVGDQ